MLHKHLFYYLNITQRRHSSSYFTSKWANVISTKLKFIEAKVEHQVMRFSTKSDYQNRNKKAPMYQRIFQEKQDLNYSNPRGNQKLFSTELQRFHPFIFPIRSLLGINKKTVISQQHHQGPIGPEGKQWDYGNRGPSEWKYYFPACGKRFQSPIPLERDHAIQKQLNLKQCPIFFNNYSKLYNGVLTNNGSTLTMELLNTSEKHLPQIVLREGEWKAQYVLKHFHFHWPSEHLVNGLRSDLELHVLHQEKDTKQKAVYSILYEIASELPKKNRSRGLDKLTSCVANLSEVGTRDIIRSFSIESILPDNYWRDFFAYVGSSTTPPCSKCTLWIVQSKPVIMKQQHMESFLRVRDISGHSMIGNFRPLQPTDGRDVLFFE